MTVAGRARSPLRLLVVCTPGLEDVTHAEVAALGLRPGRAARGGVPVTARTRDLYQLNLQLRTATRVLVRVGALPVSHFDDLAAAAGIDWDRWLPPGRPVRLRVASHSSRLYHTGAIAERLHQALGRPPAISTADDEVADDLPDVADSAPDGTVGTPLVVARLMHNQLTLSVDSSGEPLHRRGWRLATAKAPLRPTLAAAVLLACGWEPHQPLVDPMCGSGTIPIEAALRAGGQPSSTGRHFAFEAWPCFEPGTWASVRAEAQAIAVDVAVAAAARGGLAPVVAVDRDPGAVAATRGNAERAGVAAAVEVRQAVVSDLTVPEGPPGWIVTNPPWGERVAGGPDPRNLVARLGQVVAQRAPGWGVALLVPEPRLAHALGGRLTERLRTTSGGRPVRLLVRPPRPPR